MAQEKWLYDPLAKGGGRGLGQLQSQGLGHLGQATGGSPAVFYANASPSISYNASNVLTGGNKLG